MSLYDLGLLIMRFMIIVLNHIAGQHKETVTDYRCQDLIGGIEEKLDRELYKS
jgi:hypothetical protein